MRTHCAQTKLSSIMIAALGKCHQILESGYGDRSADKPSESGDAKQQSIIVFNFLLLVNRDSRRKGHGACSPNCLQVSHIIEPSGTPREYDPDNGPQTTVYAFG